MTQAEGTALKILVVDDEIIVRRSLKDWFEEDGHSVHAAADGAAALKLQHDEGPFDVALIDLKMPGMDGLELLRHLLAADPSLSVVVMTAYASVDTAVRALKEGAWDYVTKPFDPDLLSQLLRRSKEHRDLEMMNARMRQSIDEIVQPRPILGHSAAVAHVLDQIANVAPTETSVLITGESGVGKELVARAIHANSKRSYMPFVVVNCGALAEGILESELFGHERGAFTGAQFQHKGKFEAADKGTLFLDEIGEISPHTQVELLRVIEEKTVIRLGGNKSIPADFRVVAATNRDLRQHVAEGSFREDLFYRLNVFQIEVPPLRERREDIPVLAKHFCTRFARQMNRLPPRIDSIALRRLTQFDWPGNVRELSNAIERALVVQKGDVLTTEHFPMLRDRQSTPNGSSSRSLSDVERSHICRVLEATNWNISEAARILEVDRGTVYNKIRSYKIEHGTPSESNDPSSRE
jgi:DNA-binding NtrC family response regulator